METTKKTNERKQARYWVFTDQTLTLTPEIFEKAGFVRYAQWQKEKGNETGKEHYQGWMQLLEKKTRKQLLDFLHSGPHYEPAKASDTKQENYCTKPETRIDGPWEFGKKEKQGARTDLKKVAEKVKTIGHKRAIIDEPHLYLQHGKRLKELEEILNPPKVETPFIVLYEWQAKVEAILETPPEKRKIIWIWSKESGTGKSTFFEYCCSKYKVALGHPEKKRTLYAYEQTENIIWFDLAREVPLDAPLISQLEELSNQSLLMSEMYNPCIKKINSHIVVSSNRPPPHDRLPNRIVEISI